MKFTITYFATKEDRAHLSFLLFYCKAALIYFIFDNEIIKNQSFDYFFHIPYFSFRN